jgi:hypothetical protein
MALTTDPNAGERGARRARYLRQARAACLHHHRPGTRHARAAQVLLRDERLSQEVYHPRRTRAAPAPHPRRTRAAPAPRLRRTRAAPAPQSAPAPHSAPAPRRRVIALTGSHEALQKACRAYRVYFTRPTPEEVARGDYLLDHSIITITLALALALALALTLTLTLTLTPTLTLTLTRWHVATTC